MKFITHTKFLTKAALTASLLALFVTVGFYACKKPTDGINLLVNTSSLSQAATLVQFTNANPGSTTVLPSSFTVTIQGDGAKYVQVDGGGTNFTVSNGILPLSLTADAAPSPTKPVIFNIYANINGFAPVSKTVSISSVAISQLEIKLVEYANPPAGSTVLTTTTAMTNNTVALATVLKTATNADMTETATLAIPAGTQMLDASGTVISANSLNSSVIQYGTDNSLIGQSFPGGLAAANVLDANGQAIPGGVRFVTAGALGINMFAGTTEVKSFSKPITATVELQNGYINFITGNVVKAGETIPVWSFNETTGQWKSDGTATVALNSNNKLAATFNITHLSCWNLDWTWAPVYFGSSTNYNTTVHNLAVNFIPSSTPWVGTCSVWIENANGNLLADFSYTPQYDFFVQQDPTGTGNKSIPGKYGFGLTAVPTISQAKIHVSYAGKNYYSALFNPTTASSIDVNITTPAPPDLHVVFDTKAICAGKQITLPLTGWIIVYNATKGSGQSVYVNNGSGNVDLFSGDKYSLSISYSNNYYSTASTQLTTSDVTFSAAQAGAALNVTGKYDVANKTMTLKSTITLQNCK